MDPLTLTYGALYSTCLALAAFIALRPMARAFERRDERSGLRLLVLTLALLFAGLVFSELGINRAFPLSSEMTSIILD